MKPLFRREALEHRRALGFGDVIERRHRGLPAATLTCVITAGALVVWTLHFAVTPGMSLAGWLLQKLMSPR